MENRKNGESENEDTHYTSSLNNSEDNSSAKHLEDDGLGETLDQGEGDTDSGGLAGNAAGNTDAEDQ
jgi:hypothetical protein